MNLVPVPCPRDNYSCKGFSWPWIHALLYGNNDTLILLQNRQAQPSFFYYSSCFCASAVSVCYPPPGNMTASLVNYTSQCITGGQRLTSADDVGVTAVYTSLKAVYKLTSSSDCPRSSQHTSRFLCLEILGVACPFCWHCYAEKFLEGQQQQRIAADKILLAFQSYWLYFIEFLIHCQRVQTCLCVV